MVVVRRRCHGGHGCSSQPYCLSLRILLSQERCQLSLQTSRGYLWNEIILKLFHCLKLKQNYLSCHKEFGNYFGNIQRVVKYSLAAISLKWFWYKFKQCFICWNTIIWKDMGEGWNHFISHVTTTLVSLTTVHHRLAFYLMLPTNWCTLTSNMWPLVFASVIVKSVKHRGVFSICDNSECKVKCYLQFFNNSGNPPTCKC